LFPYLQTEHVEEHLALHYVLALENRELLKELTKPEQWVISDDLKASLLQLVLPQSNAMTTEKHLGLHESLFTFADG